PPDGGVAIGPNQVVEAINSSIYTFNKSTGALISNVSVRNFFPTSVTNDPQGDFFDPSTFYDDISGKFLIGYDDVNFGNSANSQTSKFIYAVSNTNDTGGGYTFHSVNTKEGSTRANGTWGDFPHVGYNADAWVLTTNQFKFGGSGSFTQVEMNV